MSNMLNASCVSLFVLALTASPSSAQRTRLGPFRNVELQPVKDNTLYQHVNGALSNGAGHSIFTGQTATGSIRRAVLAFDIAGSVPAGSRIVQVALTLHMTRTISGPKNTRLHALLADWGEGTSNASFEEGAGAPSAPGDATWQHTFFSGSFWTTDGGDFAATPSASKMVAFFGSYTWTSPGMVSDVQAWLDAPATNFGWIVIGDEVLNGSAKRFGSREGPAVLRPELSIIYDPPEGACCFLDGSCIELSDDDCTTAGGTWQGAGTSCTPDPCPP